MKRVISCLLAISMFLVFPLVALAESINTTQNPVDYFEYRSSSGSAWNNLDTPYHYLSNGDVAYCVVHDADSPSGSENYTQYDPETLYTYQVYKGLKTIFMWGYPYDRNGNADNLTEDQARYATANAIRAWLSMQAGVGYNFMNYNSSNLRARSVGGAAETWAYFVWLVQRAENDQPINYSINTAPSKWVLSPDGTYFSSTVTVTLENLNSYNVSSVPPGVSVYGYTGNSGDTLTLTVPRAYFNASLTLSFNGSTTRSASNLYWWKTGRTSDQRIVEADVVSMKAEGSANASSSFAQGNLVINKTNHVGSPLTATFQVLYNGSPVGFVNNGNGTYTCGGGETNISGSSITLYSLPAGNYAIREISTQAGYIMSADMGVTVTDGGTAYSTIVNNPTSVVIRKTDGLTGQVMPGVTFQIKNSSGTVVSTVTTDASGTVNVLALPFGTYTVSEVRNARTAPYSVLADATFTLSASTPISNPATLTRVNNPTAAVIYKTDDLTGARLSGVTFNVYSSTGILQKFTATANGYVLDAAGSATITTDSNGYLRMLYLPVGNYELDELDTEINKGYVPHANIPFEVTTAHRISNPSTISVSNEPTAAILLKTDKLTGAAMQDIEFNVYSAAGDLMKFMPTGNGYVLDAAGSENVKTDSSGFLRLLYLPVGDYKLDELDTDANIGYSSHNDIDFEITTDSKASSPAMILVENETSSVELYKTDALTGAAMQDIDFNVCSAAGDKLKFTSTTSGYVLDAAGSEIVKTDEGGSIKLLYLPIGNYTLHELATEANIHYTTHDDVMFSVLSSNNILNPSTVSIENEPTVAVISKTDALTKAIMPDVDFNVYTDSGDILRFASTPNGYVLDSKGSKKVTTDADGVIKLLYLPAGKYQLEELTSKGNVGYSLVIEPEFVVDDKSDVTSPAKKTVVNDPTTVDVVKTDGYSGEALPGVKFNVLSATGELQKFTATDNGYILDSKGDETITTDSKGKIRLLYLPTGEYSIKETEAIQGYELAKPYTITVDNDNNLKNAVMADIKNYKLYGTVVVYHRSLISKDSLFDPYSISDLQDNSFYVGPEETKFSDLKLVAVDINSAVVSPLGGSDAWEYSKLNSIQEGNAYGTVFIGDGDADATKRINSNFENSQQIEGQVSGTLSGNVTVITYWYVDHKEVPLVSSNPQTSYIDDTFNLMFVFNTLFAVLLAYIVIKRRLNVTHALAPASADPRHDAAALGDKKTLI